MTHLLDWTSVSDADWRESVLEARGRNPYAPAVRITSVPAALPGAQLGEPLHGAGYHERIAARSLRDSASSGVGSAI